jgi:hypothetical protein
MHVVVFAFLLASAAPSPAETEPSPVSPVQQAAPRALGPVVGALVGGAAGATICAAGTAAIEPSENATFAMIAVCSLVIPTSLIGAMAGASLSSTNEASAALGGGLGMLAGLFAGAGVGGVLGGAMGGPSDFETQSLGVRVGMLTGATVGASVGAGIATLE